jgi:hypothetical protein
MTPGSSAEENDICIYCKKDISELTNKELFRKFKLAEAAFTHNFYSIRPVFGASEEQIKKLEEGKKQQDKELLDDVLLYKDEMERRGLP